MSKRKKASEAFEQTGKLIIQDIPMRKDTISQVFPQITGAYEDYISAGWLLSKMDLSGGKRAHTYVQGRAVTVAVNAISFPKPVEVGDTVSFYADIIEQGDTSLTIKIESWAERRGAQKREKVTEGIFTFVAVDDKGRPESIKTQPPPGVKIKGRQPKKPTPTVEESIPEEKDFMGSVKTERQHQNYHGDVFGGWLLEQMDVYGLKAVSDITGKFGATRGIEAMKFKKPVRTGDEVHFYTEHVKTGKTSITIRVEAWARRSDRSFEKVTEGLFTYVTINQNRKPIPATPAP